MIDDWAVYRDGRRMDGPKDFSDALQEARRAGGFVWAGLHAPTEREFDAVARQFSLHPLAVQDALKAHQRPKLEVFEDSLFLVLKPVEYEEDTGAVSNEEVMVFLGDGFVLTVRHGKHSMVSPVRQRLERDPGMLGKGPTAVLYAITDSVVENYLEVATKLLIDLEELEAGVFSSSGSGSRDTASRIYTFKRQILEFQRATSPLTEPLNELAGLGPVGVTVPFVHDEARPFFRNVNGHLTRVNESVDALDRLVSDILSAHLAQMGVRQNDDMRTISSWAAMAAVPTMIAGIYGMNFIHMPELHWVGSYPVVIAVMIGLVALLYRAFKQQGWL